VLTKGPTRPSLRALALRNEPCPAACRIVAGLADGVAGVIVSVAEKVPGGGQLKVRTTLQADRVFSGSRGPER
jgi:hypothetical protein